MPLLQKALTIFVASLLSVPTNIFPGFALSSNIFFNFSRSE
jgi:hypothetical protein